MQGSRQMHPHHGGMLVAGTLDWAGTAAPWWVTPIVTLVAVVVTARITERREQRNEQRKAAIASRPLIRSAFEITPTGPYSSFLQEEAELELALLDLGFSRFQVSEMTRYLYDYRLERDRGLEATKASSIRELELHMVRIKRYRHVQDVLGRYLSGEISHRRARARMRRGHRRTRKAARRWAKSQYKALHP